MYGNRELTEDDFQTAKLYKIDRKTVEKRVFNDDWTIEEATTIPPREFVPFKETWKKWRYVAERFGVSEKLFYQRIRKQGWDPERAAKEKVNVKVPKYVFTDAEKAAMQKNDVPKNIVIMRISKLGWSRQEAVNTPRFPPGEWRE